MDKTYDYFLDMPDFERYYVKDDVYKQTDIVLSSDLFDPNIATAVNLMRSQGTNKYVIGDMLEDGVTMDEIGNKNFNDLRTQLIGDPKDFPRIMFYKFEYEDKEQIVCLFLCEVMTLDDNQMEILEALKSSLTDVAIALYPIIDPDYFDLDILINIGAIPDPDFRIHINNDLIE